jgi:hypothetical protein
MSKQEVRTDKAPAGTYSQGIVAGGFLVVKSTPRRRAGTPLARPDLAAPRRFVREVVMDRPTDELRPS